MTKQKKICKMCKKYTILFFQKKGPRTSREVPGQEVLGPGLKVLGPRDPEGPGTKKSQDLTSPKVPGLENGKSPGKMPTLLGTIAISVSPSQNKPFSKIKTDLRNLTKIYIKNS